MIELNFTMSELLKSDIAEKSFSHDERQPCTAIIILFSFGERNKCPTKTAPSDAVIFMV